MMNYTKILSFLFVFFSLVVNAQEVTNVRFEQVGKQIHIYYNLQGEGTFNTKVYCSEDDGKTWGNALVSVTGEIGEHQKLGSNKLIIWDVLKDKEELSGNIEFKIKTYKNIDMIFVKGGTFTMGSPTNDKYGNKDETQHQVTVNDFYIGKYEVTQKQWQVIMGSNPSDEMGDNLPVEEVSWYDIQVFINKLNQKTRKSYRLPTEAEWEYAARGGAKSKGFVYSGGNNLNEVGWNYDNSDSKTHPVGQKKANEIGIYDMSGNVWEWCSDWFDTYPSESQTNPHGPLTGSLRVCRGGSWFDATVLCRTTRHDGDVPDGQYNLVGFRLVETK